MIARASSSLVPVSSSLRAEVASPSAGRLLSAAPPLLPDIDTKRCRCSYRAFAAYARACSSKTTHNPQVAAPGVDARVPQRGSFSSGSEDANRASRHVRPRPSPTPATAARNAKKAKASSSSSCSGSGGSSPSSTSTTSTTASAGASTSASPAPATASSSSSASSTAPFLRRLPPEELGRYAFRCVREGRTEPELWRQIADRAKSYATNTLAPSALSNLSLAFATLRYRDRGMLDFFAQESCLTLGRFRTGDLCKLLGAYRSLDHRKPLLLKLALREVAKRAHELDLAQIAEVLQSFAHFRALNLHVLQVLRQAIAKQNWAMRDVFDSHGKVAFNHTNPLLGQADRLHNFKTALGCWDQLML